MDGKKARGAERLRLDHAERPASDTDDTMWEELLQGPDSASTGSSDTEGEAWRYRAGVNAPPTATASSDDEKLQQVSGSQGNCKASEQTLVYVRITSFLL